MCDSPTSRNEETVTAAAAAAAAGCLSGPCPKRRSAVQPGWDSDKSAQLVYNSRLFLFLKLNERISMTCSFLPMEIPFFTIECQRLMWTLSDNSAYTFATKAACKKTKRKAIRWSDVRLLYPISLATLLDPKWDKALDYKQNRNGSNIWRQRKKGQDELNHWKRVIEDTKKWI